MLATHQPQLAACYYALYRTGTIPERRRARVLHYIIRLASRAKHAVGHRSQVIARRFELLGKKFFLLMVTLPKRHSSFL